MNNSVYWSVVEDYLAASPELLRGPIRVVIEHDAAVALGDKLEIVAHVHPPGSTDQFGDELAKKTVTNAHICGRRRDEGRRVDLRPLYPFGYLTVQRTDQRKSGYRRVASEPVQLMTALRKLCKMTGSALAKIGKLKRVDLRHMSCAMLALAQ